MEMNMLYYATGVTTGIIISFVMFIVVINKQNK